MYYIFSFLCLILSASSFEMTPKLCINCRYFIKPTDGMKNEYGTCALFPIYDSDYLVDGIVRDTEYYRCSSARTLKEFCGKDATKYKKKYKKRERKIVFDFEESYRDEEKKQHEESEEVDCDDVEIPDKEEEKYIWTPFHH